MPWTHPRIIELREKLSPDIADVCHELAEDICPHITDPTTNVEIGLLKLAIAIQEFGK